MEGSATLAVIQICHEVSVHALQHNIAIYTIVSLAIIKEGAGNIGFRRLTKVTSKKHVLHCTLNFFQ